MNSTVARQAIEGILEACDEGTRKEILKGFGVPGIARPKRTRQGSVTKLQAREDLIRNHFKQ